MSLAPNDPIGELCCECGGPLDDALEPRNPQGTRTTLDPVYACSEACQAAYEASWAEWLVDRMYDR